jgi:hypothetical protein
MRTPLRATGGRWSLLGQGLAGLVVLAPLAASAQTADRVRFHDRDLFLSGGNVAWVHFARDIGPGETRLDLFEEMFRELRDHGGNTYRLWLHTNGAHTPKFQGEGLQARVVGPGEGTVEDLRAILNLAHANDIGLMLCLWSFDMLRIQTGEAVTDRNVALLSDEDALTAYIEHALVPMVEGLRGHPAILAWEVFNEPEGMSHEFGWPFNRHVPMAHIQRFINRTAGAIKRADPDVLVTNGSWSFRAASDVTSGADLLIEGKAAADLSEPEVSALRQSLSDRYAFDFSDEEVRAVYDTLAAWPPNHNYYRDDRLVATGDDPEGTLDFYTVHYYTWARTLLSPFHHDADFWALDKPLVVAEFYLDDAFGVGWEDQYATLLERGYAGALGWQWFDHWANRDGIAHNWPRALDNIRRLHEAHPEAVSFAFDE